MRTKALALALAVTVLAAASVGAETRSVHPYRVRTGQRVRLWTPPELGGLRSTNATVTAVDSSGLTVVVKDRTELVAFTDLSRMEVRRGWRHLRRAAVIGLVVGAVAGVLSEDGGDDEDKIRAGAGYGALGAGLGVITAGAIWPARWIPVDLDQIRQPPVADRGGLRVSFTFSF